MRKLLNCEMRKLLNCENCKILQQEILLLRAAITTPEIYSETVNEIVEKHWTYQLKIQKEEIKSKELLLLEYEKIVESLKQEINRLKELLQIRDEIPHRSSPQN